MMIILGHVKKQKCMPNVQLSIVHSSLFTKLYQENNFLFYGFSAISMWNTMLESQYFM